MKGFLKLAAGITAVLAIVLFGTGYQARAAEPGDDEPRPRFRGIADVQASDDAAGYFSQAIALQGDTAIIGAPGILSPDNIPIPGSAYVFVRSNGSWIEKQKLVSGDGQTQDYFGGAIALDGDTAVIGASWTDVNGAEWQGAVYVFTNIEGAWQRQQKLVASDGATEQHFGRDIALDGDTLAVSTDYGSTHVVPHHESAVYLFERNDGKWIEKQKLQFEDGLTPVSALALQGDTLIIGAAEADINENEKQGAAYVFVNNGHAWVEQKRLLAGDGQARDRFGAAVDLDGNTALVGAPEAGEDGQAYFFSRENDTWEETYWTDPYDFFSSERLDFAVSVALHGDTAVIGTTGSEDYIRVPNQGRAYVFRRNGEYWPLRQVLHVHGYNQYAADAVAFDGKTAVVGSPQWHGWGSGSRAGIYEQGFFQWLPVTARPD